MEQVVPVPLAANFPIPNVEAVLETAVPALLVSSIQDLAADHVATGEFLASLDLERSLRYPFKSDRLHVAVVSTVKQALWLEEGRAGFHLPDRWGGRWKVAKSGRRYVNIPFRVMTPIRPGQGSTTLRRRRAMPPEVHRLALRLGHGGRLGGFGDVYKQSKSYGYYRQAFPDFPETLKGLEGYTWRTSRFEGLMQVGAKRTPGGGTQSEYMTIRTMTEDSPGWYIPPAPALHIMARGHEQVQGEIEELLDAAAAADAQLLIMEATKGLF